MAEENQNYLKAVSLPFEENAVKSWYDNWSETYDEDAKKIEYNGYRQFVDHFLSFKFDKNSKILDLLGGTGLLAKMLREHGYTNIDNLDGSKGMLLQSRKQNLYNHYIFAYIGGEHAIPLLDDTYDYVIMSGGFAPGHLTSDIFPEIIRILKRGGMFLWIQGANYLVNEKLKKFHEDVKILIADGLWKQVMFRNTENYAAGMPGFLYAMMKP